MSGTKGGGRGSFEERLATARQKQGLDAPRPGTGKPGPENLSPLGIGMRVGVEMVSAMAVAVAIGWWLDRLLHTKPFLLIVFVFLGGAAGVVNAWRTFAPRPPSGPKKTN